MDNNRYFMVLYNNRVIVTCGWCKTDLRRKYPEEEIPTGKKCIAMEIKVFETEASTDSLDSVTAFIDEQLEAAGCPMKTQMQIELAVEEIFVNIANYAYAPGTGKAIIQMSVTGEPPVAEITFIDSGVQYDPLAKEDPDITLPASERSIGGLGIFLTKKTMDELSYEFRGGKNIFSMKKSLRGE